MKFSEGASVGLVLALCSLVLRFRNFRLFHYVVSTYLINLKNELDLLCEY